MKIASGRFVLEEKLGRGGMGSVHRARVVATGELVAVKLLHPHLAREERHLARFRREAEVTAALAHPHIVRIVEVGAEEDGTQWIAMELLDGPSLAQAIGETGTIAPARAIAIGRQILSALAAAHAIGVVHRDLKPANVVLVRTEALGEIAKVVDFGVARFVTTATYEALTRTGQVIGTPSYMPPEQALGKRADERVDVYAVGAIFHAMLTGEPPFGRGSYAEVLQRLLSSERTPLRERRPDLPELAAVVERALALEADARIATALELDAELARIDPRSTRTVVSWRAPVVLETLRLPRDTELDGPPSVPVAHHEAPAAPVQPGSRGSAMSRVLVVLLCVAALAMAALAAVRWREARTETRARVPDLPRVDPVPARAVVPVEASAPEAASSAEGAPSVSSEAASESAPAREARGGRARASRLFIRVSGKRGVGLERSDLDVIEEHGALRRCWPRGVPAPTEVNGREFRISVAEDGRVSSASVMPGSEQPREFAACVVRLLERTTLPRPSTGGPIELDVSISVEDPATSGWH